VLYGVLYVYVYCTVYATATVNSVYLLDYMHSQCSVPVCVCTVWFPPLPSYRPKDRRLFNFCIENTTKLP
jgi:hypothetical protein